MRAELLAPAGSYESLVAAVNAGADAVYIGGARFGARAFAENPDQEMLVQALHYCHLHGSRLYLTVNTLLKEKELENELVSFLQPLYEEGLDAVIVQDFGAFSLIRECFPGLEIHASTQMTLAGTAGCRFLEEQGASRVVLSRELGLGEIRQIHEQLQIEIEAFVHGALCYCYSGQCLFSSIIGGRSGNRGRCAQPCRLPYELTDGEKRLNAQEEAYLLSPKDICTLDILPDILEAGVFSLKIEGRMKRAEYTAGVVAIYRKYLDLYLKYGRDGYTVSKKDKEELMDLYNRGGFSGGYYETRGGRDMMSPVRPNHNGTQAAFVEEVGKGSIRIKAMEDLYPKDALDVSGMVEGKIKELVISEAVKKGKICSVRIPGSHRLKKGQTLQRVRCEQLLSRLRKQYIEEGKKEKINGNLRISKGQPAILSMIMGDYEAVVTGAEAGEAKKQPLTLEIVRKQMEKTGNTPFRFGNLQIELEGGCFLPLQNLNELRRNGMDALEETVYSAYRRQMPKVQKSNEPSQKPCGKEGLWVSLERREAFGGLAAMEDIDGIYLDSALLAFPPQKEDVLPYLETCHRSGKDCGYIMPWILRNRDEKQFGQKHSLETLALFDRILIKNIESYMLLRDAGLSHKVMLDANVYTYNKRARAFWKEAGICMDTAPLELTARELRERGGRDTELVVYGRLPLMVSAQCLHKNTGACRKKEGVVHLKDRKGKYFPVRNYCRPCYNVIYNSTPMVLLDCKKDIEQIAPSSLRLSFTVESAEEVLEIARTYISVFVRGEKAKPCFPEFTRGHFKRGIE